MTRVAVIGGCRTPFVKAGGGLARYSFIDLGVEVVKGLFGRLRLAPDAVEELAFSTVLVDPRASNFAREIIFKAGLPASIVAHSISNNCISGLVAVAMEAEAIRSGRLKLALAGGSESMSRPALSFHPKAERLFLNLFRARSMGEKLSIAFGYRPWMALPLAPSPKEPSTGLTMGQHCELMAKEFSIARELQDNIAYQSHARAAKAQAGGVLAQEIIPVGGVEKDNLIRADTSLERLAKLPPVFDRSSAGTLTAGNSSALTDGASIIGLAAEDEARKRNLDIMGYIEAIEFSAISPNDGLLMAPALALPQVLERAGKTVADIDIFEIHEAFGAQVAANLLVWEKGWSKYPDLRPIGPIPSEKINVNGGSIAIGHPFAATGGRLILSALNELKRSNRKSAAISVCAAGAMACALIVSV